ncbi:hypothetical protein MMC16_001789 [Acarospora aff. strigata]|nr:hypothetical protein [Acarospora aff. strigata]
MADRFSRRTDDEAPIICPFTPINRPLLDLANPIDYATPPDELGDSGSSPSIRKSILVVRTQVRQHVQAGTQLWTPPSTRKKESSRSIGRKKPMAVGTAPQTEQPQGSQFDTNVASSLSHGNTGGQAYTEAAPKMSNADVHFKLSNLTMSKLDSFRFQTKHSNNFTPAIPQDILESHVQNPSGSTGYSRSPPIIIQQSISRLAPILQGFSDATESHKGPNEYGQILHDHTFGLKRDELSTADSVSCVTADRTGYTTNELHVSLNTEFKSNESRTGVDDGGEAVTTNEDVWQNDPALESSGTYLPTQAENGQLHMIQVSENIQGDYEQQPLTSYTYHNDDEMSSDGKVEIPSYYQDLGPLVDVAGPVDLQPTYENDPYDSMDEFPLDPEDIDVMIDLPDIGEILEAPLRVQLSHNRYIQADAIKLVHSTKELGALSEENQLTILKNGAYLPVDGATTMGALSSCPRAAHLYSYLNTNSEIQLTATDTSDTEPNTIDDEKSFYINEEDELTIANLTAAASAEDGELTRNTTIEPLLSHKTVDVGLQTAEPAGLTSPLRTTSSPPQHIPKPASEEPFVRPPFPKSVRDRSPNNFLSSGVLRTCFRIGEALNAASLAFRTGTDVIIELYAQVRSSSREQSGWKQSFEFVDLFHGDRPPFLSGTYELWKGGALWEEDSRVFLEDSGEGKMCRAVGRLKRDVVSKMWKMVVLNIWEASWDDVAWAKGIVCA